jgi:cell wall-associated NlpC family hydrolase
MVASFHAAGVALPRTAQEQHDMAISTATDRPGELVFFGGGPNDVEHVGILIGDGLMIDAPHTGAFVRIDDADWPGLVGVGRVPGT